MITHRIQQTHWFFELILIGAIVLVTALLYLIGFTVATAVLFALLPYLIRHLLLLGQLTRLIRQHHRLIPPFPLGLWGDIYRAIAHYQQRARKGRKRQLRFSRRFREAAHSLPDALIVLDKVKRIEWANPAAAALMGILMPADQGRYFTDIVHSLPLRNYLLNGDDTRPIELIPEHNQSLILSVRVTPFGERRKQCLVVGRDITKVFHLNLIHRDFVANASHELRTPLTVIAGFLENLSESTLTPDSHQRPLNLMRNQAERMQTIIEDLLTLSRLELEEHASEMTTVAVADEVELIVIEARALSGDQHLFVLNLDTQLELIGNQRELHSALSNLIFNAVKHTPLHTVITINWHEDEQGACFRVTDNGPGIAAEHLPRLSERFYRVDKARSRASGGTGLGLAIVKHILHRHEAQFSIASELGVGSSFTCHFPAVSCLHHSPTCQ
ncbi:phosphate regulon sensor histidine kinase PhoR [Thiospirillum jenense]|uniref:Phosphate regulon sensor protein PhoR n=1 Tax=Thiospirillum jenense TaxID=1653858 RepID=A0A839HCJ1_9GAMM|nr:phosphate regulon sensor histidine kinase PhoR [Thiospirillum jenense]MBB1126653.1 phosphate regulon sensor histidine kinase PhoR [Thiospirillum jenense]